MNALRRLADYEYPNLGSFKEAIEIAQEAIDKYGGVIPNAKAAEKLGYKIKDPKKISGPIYQRLGDLARFGLFEKIRGGYRTTDLAEKALDPYDSARAIEGKAEAIRKIPIVEKAFSEWNGEIPSETAFPAKLQRLFGDISWKEAQNHTESLRNLFIECFSYIRPTPEHMMGSSSGSEVGGEDTITNAERGIMTITAKGIGFGITKTLPFTNKGIQSLKELIKFLESQIGTEETEEQMQNVQPEDDGEKG